MPRANRHYLPGYVWHITHRCHKKEFLLKFAMDKEPWIQWLFEAKKRYGLSVLNYTVTSNHVHLLVADDGDRETGPGFYSTHSGEEWPGIQSAKETAFRKRYFSNSPGPASLKFGPRYV